MITNIQMRSVMTVLIYYGDCADIFSIQAVSITHIFFFEIAYLKTAMN